jgi:uracil-DNA glycosylase family 4
MAIDPQLQNYLKKIGVYSAFSNEPINRTLEHNQKVVSQPSVTYKDQWGTKENMAPQSALSLDQCKTLENLYEAISSFNDCGLKKFALNTVICDGIKNSSIMVVGEAPGADEDAQGKPFVGKSGQLLDKMLETIGLSRKTNLYITNTVFWRPPGNRPPTDEEVSQCLPFFHKHVELFKPKIILLMGGTAAKALLNSKIGIVKLRGQINSFKAENVEQPIPLMCFYHPAYLLRSPKQKSIFWQDLLFLNNYLKENKIL